MRWREKEIEGKEGEREIKGREGESVVEILTCRGFAEERESAFNVKGICIFWLEKVNLILIVGLI